MSNRAFFWSAALRHLRADRLTRSAVCEEPLRTAGSCYDKGLLSLSAWRGRSGRRFVVVVHNLDTPDLVAEFPAVVLAVARDTCGRARLVAVRACQGGDPGFLGWLAACALLGAEEVHAHRLARSEIDREAIAADLTASAATQSSGAPL